MASASSRSARRSLPVVLAAIVTLNIVSVASAEWVVGAFAGGAHTIAGAVTVTPPAVPTTVFRDVAFRGESFASPIYYGYRAGWFASRAARVGIEAELIH